MLFSQDEFVWILHKVVPLIQECWTIMQHWERVQLLFGLNRIQVLLFTI